MPIVWLLLWNWPRPALFTWRYICRAVSQSIFYRSAVVPMYSSRCWQCMLYPCKVRNKYFINFFCVGPVYVLMKCVWRDLQKKRICQMICIWSVFLLRTKYQKSGLVSSCVATSKIGLRTGIFLAQLYTYDLFPPRAHHRIPTVRSWALLENPPLKDVPTFCGTQRFITLSQ
jgi:hypothetical protein